jgi:hypothetical protein
LLTVPEPAKQLDAHVDYGNVAGRFVRVDVALPRDSLYERDADVVTGYVALSAEEAIAFADELRELAGRVRALDGDGDRS